MEQCKARARARLFSVGIADQLTFFQLQKAHSMILMIIVLIVLFLSIASSIYISLNYTKKEEPVSPSKSPRKKIPILKYTSYKIKDLTDDSIEGLVKMALNRKQKSKKETKTLIRPTKVIKTIDAYQSLSDQESLDTVLFTEKDELFTSSSDCLAYPSPIVEPGKAPVEMANEIKFYSPFKSGLVINLDAPFAIKGDRPRSYQSTHSLYQNYSFFEKSQKFGLESIKSYPVLKKPMQSQKQ